jgi:hypothetical protein
MPALRHGQAGHRFGDVSKQDAGDEAVKNLFTPEFRNRLDAIVPFGYLPPEVVSRVVDKFVLQLELQLAEQNVHIQFDGEARAWLAKRGYDRLYGARPMARLIQERSRSRWPRNCCSASWPMAGSARQRGRRAELRADPGGAQGGQEEGQPAQGERCRQRAQRRRGMRPARTD